MNKIRAIIFDMDGVLIDAKDWHYEALNKALGLFGLEISRYDHLVSYDGLPTKKKLEMLTLERGLPQSLHAFINEIKQQYTMDLIYTRCKPIFYHQYALAKLRHEGYKIVVCSNSIRKTIEVMMEKSGLSQYLDFFLSNQDVAKAKPDPEIYQKAITKLDIDPSETLILEDNENGIRSALASGAHLLQVYSIEDVNYHNIKDRIGEIESAQ